MKPSAAHLDQPGRHPAADLSNGDRRSHDAGADHDDGRSDPFAGPAIRLRFAEVDGAGYFNASTDGVSIASTPPRPTGQRAAALASCKKRADQAPLVARPLQEVQEEGESAATLGQSQTKARIAANRNRRFGRVAAVLLCMGSSCLRRRPAPQSFFFSFTFADWVLGSPPVGV